MLRFVLHDMRIGRCRLDVEMKLVDVEGRPKRSMDETRRGSRRLLCNMVLTDSPTGFSMDLLEDASGRRRDGDPAG